MRTKILLPLFLLLLIAGYCAGGTKHHKSASKNSKLKYGDDYVGPLLKIMESKTGEGAMAGFITEGHYQFTVVQTVTPAIRVSGAQQPQVHICVENVNGRTQQGACIENLGNGYGNLNWEAEANTKCKVVAYRPDGTKIPVKKELLNTKRPWKGNEFTWEDDQYKVKVKVSRCKVTPNKIAICQY